MGLSCELRPGGLSGGGFAHSYEEAVSMHGKGVCWEHMGELPVGPTTSINSRLLVSSLSAIPTCKETPL